MKDNEDNDDRDRDRDRDKDRQAIKCFIELVTELIIPDKLRNFIITLRVSD